jgi:photosystem II stability/assembly factor-like uncharacterized protein
MKLRYQITQRIAFAALLLLAPAAWSLPAPPTPAAMAMPALHSAKAEHATLLAVTRAGTRLVAAGERGVILTSDDEGAHWKQSAVPTSVNLTALRFVDAQQGWAVGHMGIILHTRDGGLSWHKQLDGVEAARLAVAAVHDSGDKRQIKLANFLVSDGPDKPFFDIWMDKQGQGFATGAFNLIFRTDDGGAHWRYWSPRLENPYGLHLYAITRLGGDFFIAGEQGLLLRSRDGGAHFQALESPYEGSWFGLLATHAGDLFAYGLRGNAFVSHDSGDSWQPCETASRVSFSSATELADGRVVLANQAGQLFVSADRGEHFQPLPGLPGTPFAALTQTDSGALVLAGLRGLSRIAPAALSAPTVVGAPATPN